MTAMKLLAVLFLRAASGFLGGAHAFAFGAQAKRAAPRCGHLIENIPLMNPKKVYCDAPSIISKNDKKYAYHESRLLASLPPAERNQSNGNIENVTNEGKENKISLEIAGLLVWMITLSTFIIANNFAGPWPPGLDQWFSQPVWLLIHSVSGMLFSGGVILTTLIEWMVVDTVSSYNHSKKNEEESMTNALPVLQFWFDRVPTLDLAVVVPAISLAIFSGCGLAAVNYNSLGYAPIHIKGGLHALVTFAIWWGTTDLTTQGRAKSALMQMAAIRAEGADSSSPSTDVVPPVLLLRRISNIVSCVFVLVQYGLMILKPGLPPQ